MSLFNTYPKYIEVQFHNMCNANCIICPYRSMHYEKQVMSDELFEKFVMQLNDKALTRLIPYLNNEPFLDAKYFDKLRKLRKACPTTEFETSTNAALLNRDKIVALKEFKITELRVSCFGYKKATYERMMPTSDREKAFENLKIISEEFKNSNTIVSVVMIDDGSIEESEFTSMQKMCLKLNFQFCRWGFLDRAKNVANKCNNFNNKNVCGCEQNRPVERMHILANGDVIFCCQDWAHTVIVGNIGKQTISEIWNGERYNHYRSCLYDSDKVAPEICINCKLAVLPKEEN